MSDSLLPGMGDLADDGPRRFCTICKRRLAKPGKKTCTTCISKSTTNRRKSMGLCVDCNKPLDTKESVKSNCTKTLCRECAIKHNAKIKKRRDERLENGLCIKCGKPNTIPGIYCPKCLEERRVRDKTFRVKKWSQHMINVIRCQSRRRFGVESDMTEQDIIDIFNKQNGKCYWLGIPMIPREGDRHPQRITPDRLDCSKGYIKGNVVLACYFANIGRGNYEATKFREFCNLIRQTHLDEAESIHQAEKRGDSIDEKAESMILELKT